MVGFSTTAAAGGSYASACLKSAASPAGAVASSDFEACASTLICKGTVVSYELTCWWWVPELSIEAS